ncbi:hypothetical protein M0805_001114 [Coniferiporia weirii]|nr:hypothetical protein M0805_001114 [Coniferiporia weirii]
MSTEIYGPTGTAQTGIPPPSHVSSLRAAPTPDLTSERVVRFSAGGAGIPSADVRDCTGAVVYSFSSTDPGQMSMRDAAGVVVASVEGGKVSYGEADADADADGSGHAAAVKVGKVIARDRPGSTGPVLTHAGQTYEWVQELFYALLRTTPGNERVAVVYNCAGPGELAVEMLPEGACVPGLQAHVVFATALIESRVAKGGKGGAGTGTGVGVGVGGVLAKAVRKVVPRRKSSGSGSA